MSAFFVIGIALLVSEATPAEETAIARVCFVRPEDSGRMNLLPVRIYGFRADRERLLTTLFGGAEACVDIEPGDWSFEARSSRPYSQRAGNPKACRSNPFMTGTTAGVTTTIEVSPKSKGSTYVCGWGLHRQPDAAHAGVEHRPGGLSGGRSATFLPALTAAPPDTPMNRSLAGTSAIFPSPNDIIQNIRDDAGRAAAKIPLL